MGAEDYDKMRNARNGTALVAYDQFPEGDGISFVEERRTVARVETRHNAEFQCDNVSYAVELRDISQSGARIRIRQGLVPTDGQRVTLCFMNETNVAATVIWSNEQYVGVQFDEPLPDGVDVVHFDDMGACYFRAVLRFQLASA